MMRIGVLFLTFVSVAAVGSPPRYIGDGKYRHIARVKHTKKLPCPVEAEPAAIVQWQKDGQDINELWERYRVLRDGSLRIKDILKEDAGQFVCKAINGFGNVKLNYTLIVVDEETGMVHENNKLYPKTPDEDLTKESAAPIFTHPEKMKRQKIIRPVGSPLRLICRATGNPSPQVSWLKDDQVIHNNENRRPLATLRLQDLQESDSGRYTCIVSNRLGSINYTYIVHVIEKIKSKPVLLAPHPLNTTVSQGETASLQCKINSDMQPHIQWLKRVENPALVKNLSTTIDVGGQRFIVLKTGEVWNGPDGTYLNKLVISHATEVDAGMYICLGANTMGYSFRSAFLTVRSNRSRSHQSSDSSGFSLPIMIGVPSVIVVILVIIASVLLQRRKRCKYPGNANKSPHFNRVPTQEPEVYPSSSAHSNNIPTNIHINPMHGSQHKEVYSGMPPPHHIQTRNREVLSNKNSQSIDFYTDISSVSQSHHNHHHMQQYSYN